MLLEPRYSAFSLFPLSESDVMDVCPWKECTGRRVVGRYVGIQLPEGQDRTGVSRKLLFELH